MTSNDRREALVARVELAVSKDNLKTKDQHQQKRKCSVCSKSYLGQENSSTCGPTCRKRKSRG